MRRLEHLCRHYGISVPNTERFLRPDITSDGILILNLRETVTVGGIKRGVQSEGIMEPRQNRER